MFGVYPPAHLDIRVLYSDFRYYLIVLNPCINEIRLPKPVSSFSALFCFFAIAHNYQFSRFNDSSVTTLVKDQVLIILQKHFVDFNQVVLTWSCIINLNHKIWVKIAHFISQYVPAERSDQIVDSLLNLTSFFHCFQEKNNDYNLNVCVLWYNWKRCLPGSQNPQRRIPKGI